MAAGGSVAPVAEHWVPPSISDPPGPFTTMRSGGKLNGTVTISASTSEPGQLVVEAAWTVGREPRRAAAMLGGYTSARLLMDERADQVAAAIEPSEPYTQV